MGCCQCRKAARVDADGAVPAVRLFPASTRDIIITSQAQQRSVGGRRCACDRQNGGGGEQPPSGDPEPCGPQMYFPMYLMSWDTLMGLESMQPHQVLLREGRLTEYTEELEGRVIFVSHEWVGFNHPDPAGEQLACLQAMLRRLASGAVDVQSDWQLQLLHSFLEVVKGEHWKAVLPHCYFWLDFAGVPQVCCEQQDDVTAVATADHRFSATDIVQQLIKAVNSIPAYVSRCALVVVLTPVVWHQDIPDRICNFASWRSRGWCRLELMATQMTLRRVRLLKCIGPAATPEFMGGSDILNLVPGRGSFTCCTRGHRIAGNVIPCDRDKIREVVEEMINTACEHLHSAGEVGEARLLQGFRSIFTEGFPAPTMYAKPATPLACDDIVEAFEAKLRWTAEDTEDARRGKGLTRLHWAAFGSDASVVAALLQGEERSFIETPTPHGFPRYGVQTGYRPAHLAAAFGFGHEALELLLGSRANPLGRTANDSGVGVLHLAAARGVPEVISSVLEVGGQAALEQLDTFARQPATAHASFLPSSSAPALRLLLASRAEPRFSAGTCGRDAAMNCLCTKNDSDPDAVRLLLEARCCPNRVTAPTMLFWRTLETGAVTTARVLKARGRELGPVVAFLARGGLSTPLHEAAQRGDVATARVLFEFRADPSRRNRLGYTPLGLAAAAFGEVPGPLKDLFAAAEAKLHPESAEGALEAGTAAPPAAQSALRGEVSPSALSAQVGAKLVMPKVRL
mmetsp:Transcript_11391/g.30561  ORF Transcript_11391/g.30561 Transcript_11391/m.30561 type:complete len:741 (+) Transcript_11391:87-2309(+)